MILITIFDPESRVVLSHKSVSSGDMVAYAIPPDMAALVGRHVPFDEPVADGVNFVVPADPSKAPILPPPPQSDIVLVERTAP